jgi:hypothetical protein
LITREDLIGCNISVWHPLSRHASDTFQQRAQTQTVHHLVESGYGRYIERDQWTKFHFPCHVSSKALGGGRVFAS